MNHCKYLMVVVEEKEWGSIRGEEPIFYTFLNFKYAFFPT